MKSIRELSGINHELMIALDKAGFTPQKVQQIIAAPGNKLAIGMHNAVFTKEGYPLPVQGIEDKDFTLVFQSEEIDWRGGDSEAGEYAAKFWNWKRRDGRHEQVWRGMKARLYRFSSLIETAEEKIVNFAKKQNAHLPNTYGLAVADMVIGMDLPKDKFILGFDTKDRLDTNTSSTPMIASLLLETKPANIRREDGQLSDYYPLDVLILLFFEEDVWEKW